MKLVTVFSTQALAEADLVRAQLDAAGIQAVVKNQDHPYTVDPMNWVEVQVADDQADNARALLAREDSSPS